MEFILLLVYFLSAAMLFKIIDILTKKLKETNEKSKKYIYYSIQLILGIIGCYLFYKGGMLAAGSMR